MRMRNDAEGCGMELPNQPCTKLIQIIRYRSQCQKHWITPASTQLRTLQTQAVDLDQCKRVLSRTWGSISKCISMFSQNTKHMSRIVHIYIYIYKKHVFWETGRCNFKVTTLACQKDRSVLHVQEYLCLIMTTQAWVQSLGAADRQLTTPPLQ